MSTVVEIEAAIAQLPPEDFRKLKEWIDQRARMWTPEELGAAAQRMVDEPDPERAKAQWKEIVRGFYGDADA